MLLREYPKCRHGESGYNSLRQPWLIQMFKDIESIALNFVYLHMPNRPQKEETIHFITKSKSNVPSELRVSDTFFTQLSIIGRMSDNESLVPFVPCYMPLNHGKNREGQLC